MGLLTNNDYDYYTGSDLGNYAYVSLSDIINNFIVAYVGDGKLIPSIKRSDVLFHAKRGLQEFSYDTLKSIKSQEVEVPPGLSIPMPIDYVNYVKISAVDASGVKKIIYPAGNLSSVPIQPVQQDVDGEYLIDNNSSDPGVVDLNLDTTSTTEERWNAITGIPAGEPYDKRYGLDPQYAQNNGWFIIDERNGKFTFSGGLAGSIIILDYISDGLAYDADTRLPKLAEEAMYMHIAYSIISVSSQQPEYIVRRFKKDRRAALRNAKIRLSNIKLEDLTRVLRGKTKQIK
jgi:hypothetical protein